MTHATETQCAALLGILVERRNRPQRAGMLGGPQRHDWIGPALVALEQRGHATSTDAGVVVGGVRLRWYTATDAGVAAAAGGGGAVMSKTQCCLCDKPLSGGTDTFGWPGDWCWDCYAEMNGCVGEQWYGLGPHHHDLSITGHMIGSTVFDPLPEPNENGEYEIGNAIFSPDPEVPGLGVWMSKPLPGWR